ncbi:MAG TPA: hypothetical protein VKV16_04355, partial [Solirubrobacteraceae bacterium]|nr:hypothetical protein [Solirubrobacteraceae bacterium]
EGSAARTPAPARAPDAVMSGTPQLVIGVLSGRVELAQARADGLEYEGDPAILRRVRGDGARAREYPAGG